MIGKVPPAVVPPVPDAAPHSLRAVAWLRFLRAPDAQLLEDLYVPALARAVRYDRVCAYFSSRILATAARGFGGLIENLLALGDAAPRPAVRLIVNEQLQPDDLDALLATGDTRALEKQLLARLKTPKALIEKNRLQMLAWLVKQGLLEVRVGLMRRTHGMLHAKFGLVQDPHGDVLAFMGSDNETDAALVENYEELQTHVSWRDAEAAAYYRARFDKLWADEDEHVILLTLPEAVRLKLISFAPATPPAELLHAPEQVHAAMAWRLLASAAYLPHGDAAMDATAPLAGLWPHQRRVVEDTAAAFPAGRLLCDEVGMGKTVEAILALRRLLAGRGVGRALLLVPAGLQRQWQDELREKGGLLVPRWENDCLFWPDGRSAKVEAAEALTRHDLLLLSREWARLADNRAVVLAAPPWDLVLLDEAHAARRATQEESEFNSSNLLLDLLRQLQLRRQTRGLLLLSATPMQTQPWEPWDLLAVLGVGDPWQVDFDDVRDYYQAVANLCDDGLDLAAANRVAALLAQSPHLPPLPGEGSPPDGAQLANRLAFAAPSERRALADWLRAAAPLAQHMHRNTRKTLRRYHQLGLLPTAPPRRDVRDIHFDFAAAAERDTYQAIETYINQRYEQLEKEKKGKGFVMTIYRRRASSSPLALRRSLERRRADLNSIIQKHHHSGWLRPQEEELDVRDLFDADLDEHIDLGLPTTAAAAQAERIELAKLVAQLDALGATDSKYARFWEVLKDVTLDGRAALIFTEYTDTMEYLREQLRPTYGATLGCYSGGGGEIWQDGAWVPVAKADITTRLNSGQLKVLLCTDAASEGLNLQAAGALINYDLPWNPSKVEQRIGRIDRIGQQQPVLPVRNLFLADSVDDQVYGALRRRCGLFEHFVGPMQPVLARARDAFRQNLQPAEVATLISELEQIAGKVNADVAASSAYVESEAQEVALVAPTATRHDMAWALSLLTQGVGKVKARRQSDDAWKISGVSGLKQPVTLAQDRLEKARDVEPLSLIGDAIDAIARALPMPSLAPLVVRDAVEGVYHAAEARWVGPNGTEVVTSLDHLRKLVEGWDGDLPAAPAILAAQDEAMAAAQARIQAMKSQQAQVAQRALERQVAAARRRLRRELARNLRCLGSGDLDALCKLQVQKGHAAARRYQEAFKKFGGPPKWNAVEEAEATAYVDGLTEGQRQQRINLASELEAALNDPRWLAKEEGWAGH